ncbi:hypothetical protein BYT27DRAFT_7209980 [Phlegmacium glaucopus]|nr:hypothetical protein BYT27DRAFT_7209980 [Phlegmacium glaucopus]
MVESWSSPSFNMVMVVVVSSGGHNGRNTYRSEIIVCQGGSQSRDSAVMGSLIDDDGKYLTLRWAKLNAHINAKPVLPDMAVDYRRPTAVAFQNPYRSYVVVIGSGACITSWVVGVVGVVARVVGIVAGVIGVVVVQ